MKWWSMTFLVLSFPVTVWFFNRQTAVDPVTRVHNESASIDLKQAAEATLKKIEEVDNRIVAARGELMKHEADRYRMTMELSKIHAKIEDVLRRNSSSKN
ncbi:MAG: hypothetical protein NT027_09705 [Proteobacteria bacterium]|nr:hypothetical protein [Pseudomonadota bacterium]